MGPGHQKVGKSLLNIKSGTVPPKVGWLMDVLYNMPSKGGAHLIRGGTGYLSGQATGHLMWLQIYMKIWQLYNM